MLIQSFFFFPAVPRIKSLEKYIEQNFCHLWLYVASITMQVLFFTMLKCCRTRLK